MFCSSHFLCLFDYYLVKALFILGTILILKKYTFQSGKKRNRNAARMNPLQYPASLTPRTVEATRILQCLGMKSSRSNWVCLQYYLMRHKEEGARVWFSVLHYVSRTAYPHHDFTAIMFSPAALSRCALDRQRGASCWKNLCPCCKWSA